VSTPKSDPPMVSLAIIPRNMDEVRLLAKSIAGSILLPDALKREPDVIMAVIAGLELGLPPMASLRGINVIKGRPCLTAATMVAVVLGRGVAEYFECVEDLPDSVTYETKRAGGKNPQRATWTLDDAKRAQLSGDNWHKYPSDMLHARCMARLARRVYPDLLAGIYTPDEIEQTHFDDEEPTVSRHVIDAEVVEAPPSAEDLSKAQEVIDRIAAHDGRGVIAQIAAASLEELRALVPALSKLPKGAPEYVEAREAYKARLKELEAR
jgi:hypothetical protein